MCANGESDGGGLSVIGYCERIWNGVCCVEVVSVSACGMFFVVAVFVVNTHN